MNTIMHLCFLCTKDYNCVPVDDKIVSQVEYLLPEITIFKLGIPLRICSVCDGALYAFNKFKQFYVETNQRLEACIKGAQGPPLHTDNPIPGPSTELHEIRVQRDAKNKIKKKKLQQTSPQPDFCKNVIQNTVNDDKNIDKDNEEQHFEETTPAKIEEIFIKQEYINEHESQNTELYNMFENTSEEKSEQIEQVKKDEKISSDFLLEDFQCSTCNETFTAKKKLTQHVKEMHPKKFQCSMCHKSFTRKHIFINHMKLHTGKKDFICSICKKGFACKNRLDVHIKLHSEVREFQCDICKKSYSQKYNLDYHMKTHSGIRDFPCTLCDKAFACQSTLKFHLKVHAGVKEFSCFICGKSFMQKHHLNCHIKTHSAKE